MLLVPAGKLLRVLRKRQANPRFTSVDITAVLERNASAMRFYDLSRQCQSNSGATLLGGEERHKQVGAVHDARSIIKNKYVHVLSVTLPSNQYASRGLQSSIHRVLNQVDQQLIELIGINPERHVRSRSHFNFQSL